jgi:putative transposase
MHVIQRGNNRSRCFEAIEDYRRYRDILREESHRADCPIHAYVLMTNHVHLLVTPRSTNGISRMMQRLGRRYVRYFNDRRGRTGTLWEGRYRAGIIDSDRYFLTCSRYIDLNPTRASMVANPADYPWSSYRANTGESSDPLLTQHPLFEALGIDDRRRGAAYRALCRESMAEDTLRAIRRQPTAERPWGQSRDSDP